MTHISDFLTDEKMFTQKVNNVDQLRSLILESKPDEQQRLDMLLFVLNHPAIFAQLIDDMDALLQLIKIFSSEKEKAFILNKLISDKRIFTALLPNSETISILGRYLSKSILYDAHRVYSQPFAEVLETACDKKNLDLLQQLKQFLDQQMKKSSYSTAELSSIKQAVSAANLSKFTVAESQTATAVLADMQSMLALSSPRNSSINMFIKREHEILSNVVVDHQSKGKITSQKSPGMP